MSSDQTTVTLSRPGSKPHEQIDIVIPATLGSVKLLSQIGQGGMGIVYRGRDMLLNRDVAVKFLTNAIAAPDDPNFSAFLEGARSAAALQHAALTTVHQAGVVENVPYIVMQFVDGPTVSQLVKSTGPLNGQEALAILIDVAAAIAELHDRNIIHGDIKPSNVLLDPDGRVVVSDFGLSHRHRRGTTSNPSSGTPAYMAPEMFSGEVSLRSDVYALGIMGFELLAGRLPFRGDITQTQEQHRSAPLPLGELKDIGAEIADILERASHKNAMFRHKTARQFLRALQSATDSTKIAQGRYSILQRIRSLTSISPATAAPSQAPEPSTYFDHLSKIAQSKRSQRPSVQPPSLELIVRHCLHCGYDREGLPDAQACPECGHPFDLQERQAVCAEWGRKRLRMLGQLLLFNPPPAGWWEVFDRPGLHGFTSWRTAATILISAVIFAVIIATGNFLTNDIQVKRTAKAWLYRENDPQRKKVRDYGEGSETTSLFDREPRGAHVYFPLHPMPGMTTQVDWTEHFVIRRPNLREYTIYPCAVILLFIAGWIIYRHFWLYAVLKLNHELTAAQREAAMRAAAPLSMIFVGFVCWLLIFLAGLLLFYRVINYPAWGFTLIALFIAGYPAAMFLCMLGADVGRYVFPSRSLAGVLIVGAALLHVGVVALIIAIAKGLVRILA